MKKLLAIFLLSLVCLGNMAGKMAIWEHSIEAVSDGEELKTGYDANKDLKELPVTPICNRASRAMLQGYVLQNSTLLSAPLIERPELPPNAGC